MKTIQVKTFDEAMTNNQDVCNKFLTTIPYEDVISTNSLYNTILGGVIYVVVYYTNIVNPTH